MGLTAIILAAGRGSRLAPLTDRRPKCLIEVAGHAILDRQLDALEKAGAESVTVVTGHAAATVDAHLAGRHTVRTLFNPQHATSDNLASCHAARGHFDGSATLLINGDTLFEDCVLTDLLGGAATPILIAVDHKPHYDADDMKVITTNNRLRRIGKTLADANGEAIGVTLLRGEGRALFLSQVESRLATSGAERALYPEVLDALAARDQVAVRSIHGRRWIEIDTPADLAASAGWR